MNGSQQLWVFSNEFDPYIIGGLGTTATGLTRAYARQGVRTTVLSESQVSRILHTRQKSLRIIRFPLKPAYFSHKTRQFKPMAIEKWLQARGIRKPNGIHVHSVHFKNVARYYRSKHLIPVIYTCHSMIKSEPGPNNRKKRQALSNQIQLLKLADKVVVPSRSEQIRLSRTHPFCAHKLVVIHHGIATRRPKPANAPRHKLLFVGRLIPSKGIIPLLRAIAILKRDGNKVKLDLVGTGSPGYLRRLRWLIRKLRLSRDVRLVGYRKLSQVQKLYPSYGAVIMPSRQESFGLVALEALASGVPLVSTRAGGLAEFVNGNVAQTIPRVHSTAIAKSIQTMWDNRQLTQQRVAEGLELAARFQWPHAANEYRKVFRQIGSGSTEFEQL